MPDEASDIDSPIMDFEWAKRNHEKKNRDSADTITKESLLKCIVFSSNF
jgi:hypothetical protein